HLHAALMRRIEDRLEIAQRSIRRIDGGLIRNIVAVIAQRGREKRQKPDAGYAQVLQVIEPRKKAGKIAYAVAIRIAEGAHVQFINDGVFVPERIDCARQLFHSVALRYRCVICANISTQLTAEPFERGNFTPRTSAEN